MRLADIAELNPRLVKRPANEEVISFVAMADVDAESGTTSEGEDRTFSEVAKGYTQFADRDVLVAKITPCFENGKIAQAVIARQHGAGSTEFHVIRPDRSRVDDRYLLRFLRQPLIRIAGERRMTGSAGQRRVPESYLADLDIPLLPLEEQKRIAEVLDGVDALRDKRRHAIALLDDLTQSIFLDMFGDPVSNSRGWQRVKLGEVITRIDSGWSPVCLDRPASADEWGVLKLGAVTSCTFKPSENKALPPGTESREQHEVKAGDLLFSRKNTRELVAACALVKETPPRLLMSDLIFRLVTTGIDRAYLQKLLTYPAKRKKVQELAGGSAGSMPNISKARLLDFEIERPPLDLQQQFAERVEAIEAEKAKHRAHLAKLDELFSSVQSRAFAGTLFG